MLRRVKHDKISVVYTCILAVFDSEYNLAFTQCIKFVTGKTAPQNTSILTSPFVLEIASYIGPGSVVTDRHIDANSITSTTEDMTCLGLH